MTGEQPEARAFTAPLISDDGTDVIGTFTWWEHDGEPCVFVDGRCTCGAIETGWAAPADWPHGSAYWIDWP